jgi:hypothetical protein
MYFLIILVAVHIFPSSQFEGKHKLKCPVPNLYLATDHRQIQQAHPTMQFSIPEFRIMPPNQRL